MPPPLRAAAAFGIAYRPMTDDDLPFVADLYASTRAEEVAATGWPPEAQSAFLRQQHEAQHRHYQASYAPAEWLIIEQDGRPIGRVYLADLDDSIRVIDISLVPASRGSGIGGAVMSDIIGQARDRSMSVSIHVEKNNPARRLYRRLGFAVMADRGVYDLLEWIAPPSAA